MSAPRARCFAGRYGFLFGESVARIMYPRTIEKVFRRTAQWGASFPRLRFFIVIKKVCARDEKGLRSRAKILFIVSVKVKIGIAAHRRPALRVF